jgi:hypothetical protein
MTGPSKECKVRVQKHIKNHFPEMSGVRPTVKTSNRAGETRHRFTFRKALRSQDKGQFQQLVHLTADAEGKVLKVSVSR